MESERVFPDKLISSWNWKQLSQATEECLRAGWRGAAARRNEMKQETERAAKTLKASQAMGRNLAVVPKEMASHWLEAEESRLQPADF